MKIVGANKKSGYIWLISYLALLCIVAVTGWFTTGYLGDKARQEIIEHSESIVSLHSAHFTAEFETVERAVKMLSGSPWIAPALISRDVHDIANANSALDRYNKSLESSVCYLMTGDGITLASSNRNDPDSFVGKSYQFRPYFTQAIRGAQGRYFALGATSLKRGFYASCPVRDDKDVIVGVAVIKYNIDPEEAHLGEYPYLFLVDPNGIIFISSNKEMSLKSLWPLSRETQIVLLESKQFGEKEFAAILSREVEDGMAIEYNGKDYLVSRKAINREGWSLVFMASCEKILIYKSIGLIMTILICAIITAPLIIHYRISKSAELVRASEIRFRGLFNTMKSGVAVYRAKDNGEDFIITDINPAGERISRVKKEEIAGKIMTGVFPGLKDMGLFGVIKDVWRTGEHKHHPVSLYSDGCISQWVENSVYKIASGDIFAVFDDVTDRKRMEDEVIALSVTDLLTGLNNRRGFLSLAEQQLKLSDRNKSGMALFFADLDGLKRINDTLGHGEGDKALIETANVLKESFRASDIIARMGGDEFAVLAINTDEVNSGIFTARLQQLIDIRNNQESRRYNLSISMGCSYYDPENPCSIDELMARADKLMYEQKQNCRIVEAERIQA